MSQFKSSKKGFTLVELVIVIAILAILAAIAIPTVMNVIGRANESSDLANAKTMESALKTQAALDAPGAVAYTTDSAKTALKSNGISVTKCARAGNEFYIKLESVKVVSAVDAAAALAASGETTGTFVPLF